MRDIPFAPPAQFFSIKEVLARADARRLGGKTADEPTGLLHLASLGSPAPREIPAERAPAGNEPFGLHTFQAPEGTLWRKWRKLETALSAEAELIEQCRSDESVCSDVARRFLFIVEAAKAREGRDRIAEANRGINAVLRYVTDYNQHGEADRWTPPLATLAAGRGDCEDYAVAKYLVLRQAGVPAADLRLVLVHDRAVRQDHAVLAVRHEGKWLLLDNRYTAINEDMEQRNYVPLFALDQDGVKLFAAPYLGRPEPRNVKIPAPAPAATADETASKTRATLAGAETGSMAWMGRPLLL